MTRLLIAVTSSVALCASVLGAQMPRWEAVSVRRCDAATGRGAGAGAKGAGMPILSPGRMTLNCRTVHEMIATAYLLFAGGQRQKFYDVGAGGTMVEGGPPWVRTDGYTIAAVADGTPANGMMQGPMLQAILEDRFKVKVRHATREIDVYTLTVARGGATLKPFTAGTCEPIAPTSDGPPPKLPAGQRYCDSIAFPEGPNLTMLAEGATVDEFARAFLTGLFVDRPVVNRTGLTGRFDIQLTFARTLPGALAPAPDGAAAAISTALQEQLGLRLEPAKGSGQFLVIESVERPTEN